MTSLLTEMLILIQQGFYSAEGWEQKYIIDFSYWIAFPFHLPFVHTFTSAHIVSPISENLSSVLLPLADTKH